jgi:hypothetical protein
MIKKFNELFNNYSQVYTQEYLGGPEWPNIAADNDMLCLHLKTKWEPFTDKEISKIREYLPGIRKFRINLYNKEEITYYHLDIINTYTYLSTYKGVAKADVGGNGKGQEPWYSIYKNNDGWYWLELHYVVVTRGNGVWKKDIYKCDQFDGLVELLEDLLK